MSEEIFEICQLCGNHLKDKDAPCLFCTGGARKSFGVNWGWMYQQEFSAFQRNASFLALSTWLYTAPKALSQYIRKTDETERELNESRSVEWISFWGASGSGKTFLMYAFLQTLINLSKGHLSVAIKKELNSQDLIRDPSNKEGHESTLESAFPIESTKGEFEQRYFMIKQKQVIQERRGERAYKFIPGPNSHIHEILLYDSNGGLHTSGEVADQQPEKRDLSRKRISDSKYIVIMVNGKDKTTEAMLDGLDDLIQRIKSRGKFKKISICLNKIEQTDTFWKHSDNEEELQGKEIFEKCLFESCRSKTQYDKITEAINAFEENLADFCEIRYFCISSCGYLNGEQKNNLDKNRNNQLIKGGISWKPINVFPVFSWMLESIETGRIDCQDDVFAKFDQLPRAVTGMLEKLHISWDDAKQRRLREYVKYPDLKAKAGSK